MNSKGLQSYSVSYLSDCDLLGEFFEDYEDNELYIDSIIESGREEYRDTWFEYIKDYCDFL